MDAGSGAYWIWNGGNGSGYSSRRSAASWCERGCGVGGTPARD